MPLILVDGKVAISGELRGRVTVAATDDINHFYDPSLGTCDDMLGIFSGDDIVVAYSTINAPMKPYKYRERVQIVPAL